MEAKRQDAEGMLEEALGMESAVRAHAPREHPLYVATGLMFPLSGVIFDLGESAEAGAATAMVGLTLVLVAMYAATHIPYWRRYRQVRRRSTPRWLEWALAAWGAATMFGLGYLLGDTIVLAHTLGGVVGALPSLVWAERLRRTA